MPVRTRVCTYPSLHASIFRTPHSTTPSLPLPYSIHPTSVHALIMCVFTFEKHIFSLQHKVTCVHVLAHNHSYQLYNVVYATCAYTACAQALLRLWVATCLESLLYVNKSMQECRYIIRQRMRLTHGHRHC